MNFILRPNNRRLCFEQYGDIRGKPLFYFHGWPATHISAKIYNDLAMKMQVYIVAIDRPGFGESDYQKGRTMLDWPEDVLSVANHLSISKFSILGISGGSPYALVCAYKIPERINKVGIVAGPAPLNKVGFDKHTLLVNKILSKPLIRKSLIWAQFLNAHNSNPVNIYKPLWGISDKELYKNSDLVARGNATIKHAFLKGYKGPDTDMEILSKEWGFDINDITIPINLWYGSDDHKTVRKMGEYYKKHLPKNIYTVFHKEGHLISVTHATDFFTKLVVNSNE